MASILFIDDDPIFLEAITEYFEDMASESANPQRTRVYKAQGARKAIIILKQAKINVTVTDIKLREVDGIQFLAMLTKHFPNMSKVVLSTLPSDEHRESTIAAGAMVYLEKAKSREEVKQVIASIKAVLATSADEYADLKNNLEVRAAIARYCNPGIKTTLFVKTDRFIGRIIIFDGHIVHCAAAKLVGLDALKLLLNLESAQYKTDEYEKPTQATVQDGMWEGLVGVQQRPMGQDASASGAGANNSGMAGLSGIISANPPKPPLQGSGLAGKPPGKSASDIARAAIRPITSGSGTAAGSGLVNKLTAPQPASPQGSGLIGRTPARPPAPGQPQQPADSANRSNIRPITGGSGLISRPANQGPPTGTPGIPTQAENSNRSNIRPVTGGSGLVSRSPNQGPPPPPTPRPTTSPQAQASKPAPAPSQKPVTPPPNPQGFLEIEDDDLLIDELTQIDDDEPAK
jgi:DNA-binding NarL/FixJ family response regulator